MSLYRRNFGRSLVVAFFGMCPGVASLHGQEEPLTLPAKGTKHAPLGHGSSGVPYPDGGKLPQTYKSYSDPKPKVVKDRPVNATTVSQGAEELIGAELADKRCKARSGVCLRVGEKWLCTYQLHYEGLPLAETSDAMCIIHKDGHALVFRERNIPNKVNATRATVDKKAAVAIGQRDFKERSKAQKADATEPSLEIRVEGEHIGHLCWTFTVTNGSLSEPYAARYWVAAVGEARVVAVDNLIHHAHAGTVTGNLWATTPLQPAQSLPLPFLDVSHNKREIHGRPTGLGGEYLFVPGRGSAEIRATLAGPACVIENHGGGSVLTRIGRGDESGSIKLVFDARGEFEIAQVTAFYWTTLARDFAKDFLLPSHLWRLTTRVNIDATCNAGFSGADLSINFFRSGNGCQNTSSSDVVLHEYGHAFDFVHGGILDGGYSEGFGDALAILVTRQPLVGRDLSGAGTYFRDARKVVTFPPSTPEAHFAGRVYAGFTWELIQQLKKGSAHHIDEDAFEVAKRIILAADTMNPKDIPDAVRLAFLADDDDGDLTNGSPHFAQLAVAADSRRIPRPPDPIAAPGPRHAYVGGKGTHHLCAGRGTAFYTWNSARWLATLKLEKADDDYWYYCEHERPGQRWAFARQANRCGQFAVWFSAGEDPKGEWVFFNYADRLTPSSADAGRRIANTPSVVRPRRP